MNFQVGPGGQMLNITWHVKQNCDFPASSWGRVFFVRGAPPHNFNTIFTQFWDLRTMSTQFLGTCGRIFAQFLWPGRNTIFAQFLRKLRKSWKTWLLRDIRFLKVPHVGWSFSDVALLALFCSF